METLKRQLADAVGAMAATPGGGARRQNAAAALDDAIATSELLLEEMQRPWEAKLQDTQARAAALSHSRCTLTPAALSQARS